MNRSYSLLLRRSLLAAVGALALALVGCGDDGKVAEDEAVWSLAQVHPLVARDVGQVERGLPKGAELLAKHLADDPGADPAELQRRIKAARENVEDLAFSKGTFFAYATTDGVVLRSEADPDRLVEKNVLLPFPALRKALEPKAGVVVTRGEMDEMRGVRNGPDGVWVAGHSVPGKDGGAARGLFVTGWSYRAYAFYLEEAARRALTDEAKKKEKSRNTLAYVYLATGKQVYGAPVSPDVNAEALVKYDLVEKSKAGPHRGRVEITGRTFGVAAERLPSMGDDTTLAVIVTVY